MKQKIIESPILTVLVYVVAYIIGSFLIEFSTNHFLADHALNFAGMLVIGFPFGYLRHD